jgi:hypothetical protein
MWSVRHLAPLLLLAACVDLAPPVKVIDQPVVGPPIETRDGPAPDTRPPDVPPGPFVPSDVASDVVTDALDGGPPDTGPPPPAPKANGDSCSDGSECGSGFCADGLCCDTACTGACLACDFEEKPGACTPVPSGLDPKEDCALELASSCGLDGTCDGTGACRKYPDNTTCAPGSCSSATEQAASTCHGGVCQPGGTRSCAPGVCMGSSCGTTCAGPADCQPGFFCAASKCQSKRTNGAACAAAIECNSGNCVDGVCCNSACGSTCQACNLAGTPGICSPVPSGADPAGECPAQPSSPCGHVGGCNGSGACRERAAGTSCGAGTCTAAVETTAPTCNGVGTCSPGATRSCGDYLCGASSCRTSCTSAADCASNHKCASGLCLQNKIASLVVHDQVHRGDWSVRADFTIGSSGAHPWVEWPGTYIAQMDAQGAVLTGNEWLRMATDSKEYTGGPQATLTLAAAADVYLAVDDRWGASPSFMSGWSNAGWKIRVYENASRPSLPFSMWRKTNQTGMVTLPSIGATSAYNYLVVVY